MRDFREVFKLPKDKQREKKRAGFRTVLGVGLEVSVLVGKGVRGAGVARWSTKGVGASIMTVPVGTKGASSSDLAASVVIAGGASVVVAVGGSVARNSVYAAATAIAARRARTLIIVSDNGAGVKE